MSYRVSARWLRILGLVTLMAAVSGLSWAIQPKDEKSYLGSKEFFAPELSLSMTHMPLAEVLDELPNKAAWQQHRLATKASGRAPTVAYIDSRSGVTTSMIVSVPLIPGKGVGNRVTLQGVREKLGVKMTQGADVHQVTDEEVLALMRQYVRDNGGVLGIDDEQVGSGVVGQATRDLWHVAFPQSFKGVPVRHSRIVATINNGNVVLVGGESWANVRGTSTKPKLTADEAVAAGFEYAGGRSTLDSILGEPRLEIIPMTTSNSGMGQGYRHVLVWSFSFKREGEGEHWEVLVDAQKGDIISFMDLNHYLDGQTTGGIYPITSTEVCPTNGTCGEMQSGYPMPFADTGLAAPNNFTNSAGLVNSTANITTTLSGQFVNINDNCGGVSVSGSNGTIEMGGVNGDHDCDVGSGGSAGNTASARTAFYELNKLIELAQGWLPNNSWVQNQLTANLNINQTCNAFWGGGTVNFYRSGGGCRNTGELAGVFDHEWGHGLDDNDTLGSLSNTSEGYADIVNIYRLHDSCVGHGFNDGPAGSCGLTADGTGPNRNENQTGGLHCDTNCSGVRDADYLRHNPNTPDTPLNFVCSDCLTGPGPCGRQVHCSAAPIRQAAWDLVTQDLPFDRQTNFVIGNKVFYQGSGAINTWYSCTCGSSSSGCGSGSGYLQWLAADDDDGNINNGTPHMQEIFNAFDRHGIACSSPTPQNSGCAGGPTTAPTLAASPGDNSASLSWNSVSGASEYWVFRTEGHAGCDFGKALIAEVGGTSFTDTEVASGRDYWYSVMAAGTSDACFSTLSNCVQVTPADDGPNVTITAPANGSSFNSGDLVTFTGTAIDPQDGDISASISWSSSVDGSLGTGASVATSSLSVGNHTITASATDSTSLVGTDQISITILPSAGDLAYETDFEANDGGWVDGSSTCTTGTFIRGTPDLVSDGGVTTQPNGASGGTFAWFTQNNGGGVGTDDVDGGTCETLSPSVAVADGATLSLFIDFYHGQRDANDDANDGFSIEVYNTGTGTALATLVSIGDVANNAVWTSDNTSWTNTTGSSVNAAIRVRATDAAAAGDLVEGGIDNVQVFVSGGGPECTVNADCDDNNVCNGTETCNTGTGLCEAGTPLVCDDGLFCNGAESCDAALGCQAGTAPDCGDGVSCTVDSCNETTDSCDNTADNSLCPDDGLFCTGTEFCDAVLDCQSTGDPCTGSQTCNETGDICEDPPPGGCSHSTDFESGANGWTGNTGDCSTGDFIVGTPDATTWQVGGGNPGQAFFTANNGGGLGTDDVDGGTCEALSPTVDCNGQATADVSLDYFHGQRDANDDAADGFTIEVLNNGVVVDTIVNIGDVTNNPAWTNVSTTVVSPGNIQVRVRASDAPNGGDIVEGGIDNVVIGPGGPPPSCTYEEGFESGLAGWTNNGSSTCSTGDYVQGNPTNPGGGQQIVGSNTGSGSLFTAVNASAGSNDVDGGNCILDSPALASSATETQTLSVFYWHGQRDNADDPNGGAPNGDFFILEYSTDGGSSWTTMASNGDAPSTAAWTQATASIPAGSDVRVRVQCSDGSSAGDLVECGIDDVSICN